MSMLAKAAPGLPRRTLMEQFRTINQENARAQAERVASRERIAQLKEERISRMALEVLRATDAKRAAAAAAAGGAAAGGGGGGGGAEDLAEMRREAVRAVLRPPALAGTKRKQEAPSTAIRKAANAQLLQSIKQGEDREEALVRFARMRRPRFNTPEERISWILSSGLIEEGEEEIAERYFCLGVRDDNVRVVTALLAAGLEAEELMCDGRSAMEVSLRSPVVNPEGKLQIVRDLLGLEQYANLDDVFQNKSLRALDKKRICMAIIQKQKFASFTFLYLCRDEPEFLLMAMDAIFELGSEKPLATAEAAAEALNRAAYEYNTEEDKCLLAALRDKVLMFGHTHGFERRVAEIFARSPPIAALEE
jgi:hypothetical protein